MPRSRYRQPSYYEQDLYSERPQRLNLGQMLLEQGDLEAERAQNLWSGIGQTVAGLGQQYGRLREEQAARQEEERKQEGLRARDAAIANVFQSWDGKDASQLHRALIRHTDPKSALDLAKGAEGLQRLAVAKSPEEASKELVPVARGFKASSPEMRARLYPSAIRPSLAKSGLVPEDQLPSEYGPEVDQFVDYVLGMQAPQKPTGEIVETIGPNGEPIKRRVTEQELAAPGGVPVYKPPVKETPVKAAWGQPFNGPDGLSYQRNEQTGEIRRTPGVGAKAVEPAPELQLNPEGVVLSGYGIKQKEEARKQARERGLPVFENVTAQTKGVTLAGIAAEAKELANLLEDPNVQGVIGPMLMNPKAALRRVSAGYVDLDPQAQRALQLMSSLSDTELRKRSGASITEPEFQRMLKFSTDPTKPLGHNRTAIRGLLKSSARDYRALSGVDIGGEQAEGGTDEEPPDA